MKLLFAIAHCFNPGARGENRSTGADPEARLAALTTCLASLHRTFGSRRYVLDLGRKEFNPAEEAAAAEIEVVVCTAGDLHLLDRLPLPEGLYEHRPTEAEPELLGFECQAVFAEAVGRFDYYCYLEDDLGLSDPLFFSKLAWFDGQAGSNALLQPNRFEADLENGGRRAYIDGDLPASFTERFQDIELRPVLEAPLMDRRYAFRRPLNPHAGCYFLNRRQLERWLGHPSFLDRSPDFVGPLESAATLGPMRTFDVYKPAAANMGFLEVEHLDRRVLGVHV